MHNQFPTQYALTKEEQKELQRQFILKVFGWMAIGLLLTGMMS
ncbi:MAG: BAX inhibitor (BI)-1/YccA family protein, partial [Verrucomicrobia bacterium]|nr:BAX inhibitor (BI)-1/YccA family protein [Verrucomicrobiota bacterium]